jgi:uncharacterized membrane protein
MISSGEQNDQLRIDVIEPIFFVSVETGVVIDPTTGFEGSNQRSIPA